jgi:hypothetical protein
MSAQGPRRHRQRRDDYQGQLDEAFEKAVQMTGVKVSDLTSEQRWKAIDQLLDELITEKLVTKAATGVRRAPGGNRRSNRQNRGAFQRGGF